MKLAVPDLISNSYFPAAAAVELGFFKEQGLDVSLELIFPVDKAYEALRDGAVDFVGGSAHSVLAAFPEWRGAKLLCAQAQGMYWFLVMRADLGPRRGDARPVAAALRFVMVVRVRGIVVVGHDDRAAGVLAGDAAHDVPLVRPPLLVVQPAAPPGVMEVGSPGEGVLARPRARRRGRSHPRAAA